MLVLMADMPELMVGDNQHPLDLALRFGRDRPWRTQCSQRTLDVTWQLFDDPTPVAALQEFLLSLPPPTA